MIRTHSHLRCGLAALLLLAAAARADEAVLTRRALELRASPGDGGASVASLPQQSPVTRLDGRQGPWVQVRSAQGATGWVHLFDLGPATASGGSNGSSGGGFVSGALRGVTGLFDSGTPRQTGTTAGIRGLEAEDLANAHPDPAGVQRMAGWRASESDARTFAGRAPWRAVAVEPLPAPAAARAGEAAREQLP
ncbi:SH3 domain-containing protein [Ramlibacter sp. XY19]|uniref:SH3 domain-containing protein n=1 Tax=Ramlibacter paludis TaxID=2908000 RepID=UPI0023DCE2E7|nr:SH3 domain-containing protein [Ramlibacter paludis]MCG2591969.1 SH3 domain-containing protein [Ramlibacter paludis]